MSATRLVTLGTLGGTIITDTGVTASITQGLGGTGQLIKQGPGTLSLGASSYTGGTDIQDGTLAGFDNSFGSGNIEDDGAIIISQPQNGTLTNIITGTGSFTKYGPGVLTIAGAQSYSGMTDIQSGELRPGAAQILSPNSAFTVDPGATLNMAGYNQTIGQLTNNGTVSLAGAKPGAVLTVSGDYTGTGVLSTTINLGGNGSETDKLVVGQNVSGTTLMEVNNQDGLGALTTGSGIEEVQVGGTSTTQAFTLAGQHVDAGAYQYRLYKGDLYGKGNNWYLRSTLPLDPPNPEPVTPTPISVTPAPTPVTPAPMPVTPAPTPVTPAPTPVTPAPTPETPAPVVITYRTAVPLYSALVGELQQADLMMLSNFHQRVGETPETSNSMTWMRAIGGKVDVKADGEATPHSNGYLAGFQIGSDIYSGHGWRVGGYFGYLHGNMNVSGFEDGTIGGAGSSRMNNEYLGIYGTHTWQDGAYLDLVLQGGYQRTDLSPQGDTSEGLSSKSGSASAEVGKPFALGNTNWSIEPEGQVVRQWLSVNNAYISGYTTVHQRRTNGWLFRAGSRLVNNSDTRWGQLSTYTRVNFYYAPNGASLTDFDTADADTTLRTASQYASLELAAGGTLSVSRRTNIYGEVGHVWSVGGGAAVKQSIEGTMGIRVNW